MSEELEELIKIRTLLEEIHKEITRTEDEVLTVEDVMRIVKRSKSCIYNLVHKKAIPFYRTNGKSLYFKKSEIEQWLYKNPNYKYQK